MQGDRVLHGCSFPIHHVVRLQWNMSCISYCQFPSAWIIISLTTHSWDVRRTSMRVSAGCFLMAGGLQSPCWSHKWTAWSPLPWADVPLKNDSLKPKITLGYQNTVSSVGRTVIRLSSVRPPGVSCWSHSMPQLVHSVQTLSRLWCVETKINHIN